MGWNLWGELAFKGRTETTVELGCVKGAWSQHQPSPPGRIDTENSGVCEEDQVSTPLPPTRMDRDSGVAESEVREGAQVKKTNPPPPTSTDRDIRVAVRRVGGV